MNYPNLFDDAAPLPPPVVKQIITPKPIIKPAPEVEEDFEEVREAERGLTQAQRERLAKLRNDFGFFSKNLLNVRTKVGAIKPLSINRAQRRLHEKLELQRKETGKVRAILLKGRQMGASTYIQGRFYWRLWGGEGLKAFILTHEQAATDNLFGMAQRYHDLIPPAFKRPTKAANAKELAFSDNNCSYAVATAGSKGVGRSSTIQLFHGSEAAFWPNAESHIDGIVQAIPDEDGTERIFESTANGIGNVFHKRWIAAEKGDSEDQAIFLPWFWDDSYTLLPPSGWVPTYEWAEYGDTYRLSDAALYWAYMRSRDMGNATGESPSQPCWRFHQEFPADANLAFTTSGNSFIPAMAVARARKASVVGIGPLIIGVDPARGGGDKTGIVDRRGRRIGQLLCETWDESDLMSLAGRVANLIKKYNPHAVNIDVGGVGAGVYDRLRELGYDCVNAVNFGSRPLGIGPTGDELYANRRSEMWDLLRAWFDEVDGVQIVDNDGLQTDLTAPEWGQGATRYNSSNELLIEPKEKIKERLGGSPDLGDAAALTFAVPFMPRTSNFGPRQRRGTNSSTGY